jgi:hypothetical protein
LIFAAPTASVYPVATGKAAILRTIAANSRRLPAAGRSEVTWEPLPAAGRLEIDLERGDEGELKGLILYLTHWVWTSGASSSRLRPHEY